MRPRTVGSLVLIVPLAACGPRPTPEERAQAVAAFATVQEVFQHPRCRNCHIPGDAPLQFDASLPHAMGVARGPEGHGAPGLPCATCHGNTNPPASYGPEAPPGAPHWGLPPPDHKMAWIGLSPAALCDMIKDRKSNGGRDFDALTKHVSEDSLVLWGWHPGGDRAPVSVPHDVFVTRFKQWAAAGGPCPGERVALSAGPEDQAGW
jgi:mono/diheme cytochrome c family protein